MAVDLGLDHIEARSVQHPFRRIEEQRLLRDALGCFPTGVAVVTGRTAAGALFGLTINSFSSLSLDPPLIAWSIRSSSPLLSCFQLGATFTVNVLGSDQETVARQFSAARADRFAGVDWRHGLSGLPHLNGAIAFFDCRLSASHVAGDHQLLIGVVDRFAVATGEPLLFVQGTYRTL